MTKLTLAERIKRVQPVVFKIFREVTGGLEPAPSRDLAALEDGIEGLWERTQEKFGLDESWKGDGTAVNGTLADYVRHVARAWSGRTPRRAPPRRLGRTGQGRTAPVLDSKGNTLLHLAAMDKRVGQQDKVAQLVDQLGIDVNAVNAFGWTALHCACDKIPNKAFIARLIARGADPSIASTKRQGRWKAGTTAADLLADTGYERSDGTRVHLWGEFTPETGQIYFRATAEELLRPPKGGHRGSRTAYEP